MRAANPTDPEKLSRPLRRVLFLLTLSIFINYIDRSNLSLAAPLLKDELRLSPWQLGVLLGSFFWTYDGFQIPSGWLTDRFDVSWVLGLGFLLWSCATAATGLMHGQPLLNLLLQCAMMVVFLVYGLFGLERAEAVLGFLLLFAPLSVAVEDLTAISETSGGAVAAGSGK